MIHRPQTSLFGHVVWHGVMLFTLALPCRAVQAQQGADQRVEAAVNRYAAAMDCEDRDQRLQMFSRAEQLFRQVIEGDGHYAPVQNADLYTNMGNAALQAERIGPAIVAYRKALALEPQHDQARQNLTYCAVAASRLGSQRRVARADRFIVLLACDAQQ